MASKEYTSVEAGKWLSKFFVRDLEKSVIEEIKAAAVYEFRAQRADRIGDMDTAKLYRHIAAEERGHENEFKRQIPKVTTWWAVEISKKVAEGRTNWLADWQKFYMPFEG